MKILGLDVSSKTIGWSLFDKQKLINYGHLKPVGEGLDLLLWAHNAITLLIAQLKPNVVRIEDIALYMSGKSNAKTITLLCSINRVVGVACKLLCNDVEYMNVNTIRKIIGKKLDCIIAKEDLPQLIRDHLDPSFVNIVGSRGGIKKETYDRADAIAVVWAYLLESDRQIK